MHYSIYPMQCFEWISYYRRGFRFGVRSLVRHRSLSFGWMTIMSRIMPNPNVLAEPQPNCMQRSLNAHRSKNSTRHNVRSQIRPAHPLKYMDTVWWCSFDVADWISVMMCLSTACGMIIVPVEQAHTFPPPINHMLTKRTCNDGQKKKRLELCKANANDDNDDDGDWIVWFVYPIVQWRMAIWYIAYMETMLAWKTIGYGPEWMSDGEW